MHEKSSTVFTHGSMLVTEIIQQTAWDVLHEDVNEVFNDTARLLLYRTFRAVVKKLDNVGVVQTFQNLDLSLDWFDVFLILLKELFAK